jgi:Zn-dependent M28 family amino/carboxypeptidase
VDTHHNPDRALGVGIVVSLAPRHAFPLLATLVLLAGCIQSPASGGDDGNGATDGTTGVTSDVPHLDAAVVLATLKDFAATYPVRQDNGPGHEGARQWMLQQWQDAGLTTYRQDFTNGIEQANIIGIKWGQDRENWVVVGGHYDTTHNDCIVAGQLDSDQCPVQDAASQGIYDDGSGTIFTVELGKLWADLPSYYTIAFVAYDGEERGLQGAGYFVENATETGMVGPYNVTIRGALDIDMFGITWPGTNAPTQILDNSNALHKVFQDTRKAMGMPDDMYFCGDQVTLGSSDFQAYFDHDIPVVFFSSDFGKYTPPGSPVASPQAVYPNWHVADNWDTMVLNAGSEAKLLQGFQTAADLNVAELHAMANTRLDLDVHTPVTGEC